MLKFTRKERGKRKKECRAREEKEKEMRERGRERKRIVYLIMGEKKNMCNKKRNCLTCYKEGENFLSPAQKCHQRIVFTKARPNFFLNEVVVALWSIVRYNEKLAENSRMQGLYIVCRQLLLFTICSGCLFPRIQYCMYKTL